MQSKQSNEFSIRSQALTPLEILRSATLNGAKLLGMESRIGAIERQHSADLLIVNANPLEDISVLDRIDESYLAILKEGRVVRSRIDDLETDAIYRGRQGIDAPKL